MIELLSSAIRLTVPVGFVGLGETVGEKAGVLNIGIEGVMLLGCFTAAWAALETGSVLVGFLAAMVLCAIVLALLAVLVVGLKADQIVVGVGVNLTALGLTTVAVKAMPEVNSTPHLTALHPPLLGDLPWVGELFRQNWCAYGLVATTALLAFVFGRSAWGLRTRAVGEEPAATDAAGVRVERLRVEAMLVSGALVGLGGAALSIGDLRGFTENMVAGRGFIALAAVIFGRWRPWGVVGACFVFGIADAFRFQLPSWGYDVPPSILYMTPYLVALVALALLRGAAQPPAALTVPFERRR